MKCCSPPAWAARLRPALVPPRPPPSSSSSSSLLSPPPPPATANRVSSVSSSALFSSRPSLASPSSLLVRPAPSTWTSTSRALPLAHFRSCSHSSRPSRPVSLSSFISPSSFSSSSSHSASTPPSPSTATTTTLRHHRTFKSKTMEEKADMSRYLKQSHDRVFEHNRAWAEQCRARDPNYFVSLAAGQTPEYLWIGCSDSRIPAEQIAGLQPGEAFVHRNIANLVPSIDLNVMSVLNYAVDHLKVKHVVVCGHYGCGGVKAAMTPQDLGILNPWLRNIRDVYRLHEAELDAIADPDARYDRLVELNVVEQCRNVVKLASVQQSYARNAYPVVHGWVFDFRNGLLKDLKVDFEGMLKDVQKIYNLVGN